MELFEHNGVRLYHRPETPDRIAIDFNVRSKQQLKGVTLNRSQRWLDLGAHIGAFACTIASQVDTVVAVEGDTGNAELLAKNVDLNGLQNVTVFHAAVVAFPAESVTFYESAKGKTLSGGILPKRGRVPVEVPAFTCNELFETFDITHVKISIEGAEGPIVLATDWTQIQFVEIEYNFWASGDTDHEQYERMLDYLERFFGRVEGSRNRSNVWHRRVFCYKE